MERTGEKKFKYTYIARCEKYYHYVPTQISSKIFLCYIYYRKLYESNYTPIKSLPFSLCLAKLNLFTKMFLQRQSKNNMRLFYLSKLRKYLKQYNFLIFVIFIILYITLLFYFPLHNIQYTKFNKIFFSLKRY